MSLDKNAEIAASLSRAGIGRGFHRRRLNEFGAPGETLEAWVRHEEFRARIGDGRGWTLVGDLPAYDATLVLARACHLRGVKCRVLPLSTLGELVASDEADELDIAEALFVTRFYDDRLEDNPMEPWLAYRVEGFLMSWMEENLPLSVHSTATLPGTTWWSTTLLSRIAQRNEELVIR